jgi:hypothetical protein
MYSYIQAASIMIGASAVEHAEQPTDILDAWRDIISFLLTDKGIKVHA